MKVAVIHDWLTVDGGAERVLQQILNCYPEADLFSLVDFLPESQRWFLQGKTAQTSFLQKLPWAKKHYRHYLALMPLAIEQFDLSGYDLVISSSYAVAKGVLTGPDTVHVSYVHSPIRYAWDLQHQYLSESGLNKGIKSFLVRSILHYIRLWDSRTAAGVDQFVANSQFIGRRIRKVYRRESKVVYPPVDISRFALHEGPRDNFYLTASRLVPYKKISLIVEAFSATPERRLVVIGDGPEFKRIQAKAGANVQMLGYQPFEVMLDHMQRAKAFVFAAEEDFGITPVEAQACGTPVIAYGRGGALETVRDLDTEQPTGLFFSQQSVASLLAAVERFEQLSWSAQYCRNNAQRFAPEQFCQGLRAVVAETLEAF